MPSRKSDVGLALALAGIFSLSGAVYLWISAATIQAMALTLVGLAALIGAGPFLFGWTVRAIHGHAASPCASCGHVPSADSMALPFCMMCGKVPKAVRA